MDQQFFACQLGELGTFLKRSTKVNDIIFSVYFIVLNGITNARIIFIAGNLLVDFAPDIHVDELKTLLTRHKEQFAVKESI